MPVCTQPHKHFRRKPPTRGRPQEKRARPDQTNPEPKRSKKRARKRQQSSNRQGSPAAKRIRLESPEPEAQPPSDTVAELEALQGLLAFEMNDEETEAAKQLFERLKSKKVRIKPSLYKLLARVNRENLPAFCAKAAIFFGSLTASIKDTGCLTSMLGNGKKHIRDFAGRKDSELEYLAGLDTLRAFSSMCNRKGLPKQADVEAVKGWAVWTVDGQFSMELFRAVSSMHSSRGLPDEATVKAMLDWAVWTVDGQFSMELFRAVSSMHSSRGLPDQAKVKAINDFLPQERMKYLFFSRNLKAPPNKDDWNDLQSSLDRLVSVLKTSHAQRDYLEVIWNLAPSDRGVFLDETGAASVMELFPSLNALKNLANRYSRQRLKELLETCLQLRQGVPSRENIKKLFTATA